MRCPLPILPLLGVSCVLVAPTPRAGTPGASCDTPSVSRDLAGADATDCGFVPLGEDPGPAWACAVAAFESGAPFFLAWEDAGIDSILVHGLASDGASAWSLFQDRYDEAPWPVDGRDCLDPVVAPAADDPYDGVDEAGLTVVACTATAPEGNRYLMCGPMCTCSPEPLPFPW